LQKAVLQAQTFDRLADAKAISDKFKSPQGADIYAQERNTMFLLLKEAVTTYNKQKDIIGNTVIGNCVDIYETVKDLAYRNTGVEAVSASCPYLSRESLAVGCYLSADPETKLTTVCSSCSNYQRTKFDENGVINVCSGYNERSSCESDPCNAGDCVWDGPVGGCKAGFDVFGQTNGWDAS